jgi:hypothetical protein
MQTVGTQITIEEAKNIDPNRSIALEVRDGKIKGIVKNNRFSQKPIIKHSSPYNPLYPPAREKYTL